MFTRPNKSKLRGFLAAISVGFACLAGHPGHAQVAPAPQTYAVDSVIGSDGNPCNETAKCKTWAKVSSVAPAGSTINTNGTLTDVVITKSYYIKSESVGSTTISPVSNTTAVEFNNPGGWATLDGVLLTTTSGKTDVQVGVTSGQQVTIKNSNFVTTNGQALVNSTPNSSSISLLDDIVSGTGLGIQLEQLNSGNIVVTNVSCLNNPSVDPAGSGNETDNASCISIFADGPSSTYTAASGGNPATNSVNFTITNPFVQTVLPAATSGAVKLISAIQIAGAAGSIQGGTVSLSTPSTDTLTHCIPTYLTVSLVNPVRVANWTVNGVDTTFNCIAGGTAATKLGPESAPETMSANGSQTGTTITLTRQEPNTFANNIPTSNGSILPDASNILPETITSQASGPTGGIGTYNVNLSQSISSLRARIVSATGANLRANISQTGTLVTINSITANTDSQVTNPNEQVGFGPFAGMSASAIPNGRNGAVLEKLVSCTQTGGVGTCTADTAQTVPAGPIFILAANEVDTVVDSNNRTYIEVENPLNSVEGGMAWVGFVANAQIFGNYGYGGQYGYNIKGAPGWVMYSNVYVAGHRPASLGLAAGAPNYDQEHNTFVSPYSTATGGLQYDSADDWSQTDVPYTNHGFRSSNIIDYPIINGGLGFSGPSGALSDAYGPGKVNYGPFFEGDENPCISGIGVCWGTPDYSADGTVYTSDAFYNRSGSVASLYFWQIDNAVATWTGSAWTGATQVATTSLATYQADFEPDAQVADPVLTQWSPLVTPVAPYGTNLDVHSQPISMLISGCQPLTVSGGLDFYEFPYDTNSPSCGAAQYKGGYGGSGTLSTYNGQQYTLGGVTDTEYYMGFTGSMTSLVTTETNITTTAPKGGTLVSFTFVIHTKPGYDTANPPGCSPSGPQCAVDLTGYAVATLYQNGSATGVTCYVQPLYNTCRWSGAGPTIASTDRLSIQYCVSGTNTGCTTLANGFVGKIDTTLQIQSTTLNAPASALTNGTTGSGEIVLQTSPSLVTPALGTPASGNLSNTTNLPAGQLIGMVPSGTLPLATSSAPGAVTSPNTTTSGDVVTYTGTSGHFADSGTPISSIPTLAGNNTFAGIFNVNQSTASAWIAEPIEFQGVDGTGPFIPIIGSSATPTIALFRLQGTYSSATAIVSGAIVGIYEAGGYDGTSNNFSAGALFCTASANWVHGTTTETRCEIKATPPGSTSTEIEERFQNGVAAGSGTPQGVGTYNAPNGYYAGSKQVINSSGTVQLAAAPPGSIVLFEATGVSVASTGDAAINLPLTVGNGGYYLPNNVYLYNCTSGAVGTLTATLRTATGGGGTAIATWSAVTPPSAGNVVQASPIASSTVINATPLTLNITVADTGTCSILFYIKMAPAT